jgi:hypothetical protein
MTNPLEFQQQSNLLSSRMSLCRTFILSVLVGLGTAEALNAQLNATATITSQSVGGGMYDYLITLNNSASSTSSIETFWYAWLPNGDNFLPSYPSSVTPPNASWNYSISTGYYGYYYYYYDYGIEFTSTSDPIAPGSSRNFEFVTSDPPSVINGESTIYPGYQVGTSYVYSGIVSGNTEQIVVTQPVPEPSLVSLLALGALFCCSRGFHWQGLSAARARSRL